MKKIIGWAIHVALVTPILVLIALAFGNRLGVDPVKTILDATGTTALVILTISLSLTPFSRLTHWRIAKIFKGKSRAIGLAVFWYVSAHLCLQILYEGGLGWLPETIDKPFIYFGMAGWGILLVLAVTSWDRIKRRLGGKAWKRLHRMAYVVGILAMIHYGMAGKGHRDQALVYLLIVLGLRAAEKLKSHCQRTYTDRG